MSEPLAEILRAAAPFSLLGALLGAGYFRALRHNVERYLAGAPLGPSLALHLGRLALAGLAFALIAKVGAAPLLAALAGFLFARALAVHRVRTGP